MTDEEKVEAANLIAKLAHDGLERQEQINRRLEKIQNRIEAIYSLVWVVAIIVSAMLCFKL